MSIYSYKGVPLSQIYDSSGISITVPYIGMPISTGSTPYNYLIPNSYGYLSSNLQLNKTVKAQFASYNNTQNAVTPPLNCKSINVIAVGGGGGGGGAGGDATAENNLFGKITSKQYGGSGGTGGYASYDASSGISVYNNSNGPITISINIGTAGTCGNAGDSKKCSSDGSSKSTTYGDPGNDGNAGNATTVTVGTTLVVQANGGNGGSGGGGAEANANTEGADSKAGDDGTNGNATTSQYSGDPNTYPSLGNSGNPGSGGIAKNSVPATNGIPGSVQIIWLYD
jgi:hypothetical protein